MIPAAGAIAEVERRVRAEYFVPPATAGWTETVDAARIAAEKRPFDEPDRPDPACIVHDHEFDDRLPELCSGRRCHYVFEVAP